MTAPSERSVGLLRISLIVFLVSLALLNAQVTVTRLLAYRFFYHFVFLAISLAQLGLAGAGAWLYASKRLASRPGDLHRWLLLQAAMPLVVLAAYAWLAPEPNLSLAKLQGRPAYLYLSLLAVLLVVFNFAGGMVLASVFAHHRDKIGRLYASDLVGAALGCIASVGLMMGVGPIRSFVASGLAPALAALLLAGDGRRRAGALACAAALAGAFAAPGVFDPWVRSERMQEALVRSEWDHLARVDRGVSGHYVIDGDASTHLRSGARLDGDVEYELVPPAPDVAIIGVGAGPQLKAAVEHGASSVLAVDINPTIVDWAMDEDRFENDSLFHRPGVEVVVGEGRHVLRSSERDFDLIVMHAIDTWTASSQGAYSLTENFLYTSEAMADLLSKLRPGGIVSIRRWLFWPPRENLRLFTTIYRALERAGAEAPERHLLVASPRQEYRDPGAQVFGFVIFSNEPLAPAPLARFESFVEAHDWSVLYHPDRDIDTPFLDFVRASDRQAFYDGYPYTVRPARDDNPFFFQFAPPWSSWLESQRFFSVLYGDSSKLLFVCLALCVALSFVLLAVPLALRREELGQGRPMGAALVYFGCLGVGFMAFELPAIQVMTLLLGHPTYALSVVLLGLLSAAGLGSALMGRASHRVGRAALLAVAGLAVLSALGLLDLVHRVIDAGAPLRFALTLVYLLVIGVPLGMPFVAGIARLDTDRPHEVAWAWAANGAAGVVGACVLTILMVYAGGSAAFLTAAGCYGVAFLVHRRLAA